MLLYLLPLLLLWEGSDHPFAFQRAFATAAGAVVVGTDSDRLVVVECKMEGKPSFRVLSDREARPWLQRVNVISGTEGSRRVIHVASLKKPAPRIPPLPKTTFARFAALRPRRVKDGYRENSQYEDMVGPWEKEGELIWFGKTFYDGEGLTSVGGFGDFNLQTRKFHLLQPPEIRDWSVAAMNVSTDAIWMALVHNGEDGGSGGGLLRYDRESGAILRLPLKAVTTQLVRHGDTLLAATTEGIAVARSNHVRRYVIDQTKDGKLKLSRANI